MGFMDGLFGHHRAPTSETTGQKTRVVGVAVNANVWGSFDYLWPEALGTAVVAQRVRVPFGRGDRKHLGFVVATEVPDRTGAGKLKSICELVDSEPLLDEQLLKLAEWISHYYLSPLGMTLAAMVPGAIGVSRRRTETVASLSSAPSDWHAALGPRQRRVLDELLEAKRQGVEQLELKSLRGHSGASVDSIRRLAKRGLIHLTARPVQLGELSDAAGADPFELNDEQKAVLTGLEAKLSGGFSATLLYGVTGSGKTEIYIRAIRRVIEAGMGAILLVPEIALVTHTLQRLVKRLPRVAVLHSGLTDAQRSFYHERIRRGVASVVVGPRSAIFAPMPKLGLIIVDEEHEPSYKQDTSPRYHGRDVAIKRAALADVPIILGSATPSLESLRNVQLKRYEMLRLPHRVRNLPLPKLKIVHLRKDIRRGKIELLGGTLTAKIAAALDRREQIILLMNRRGYASYVFCPSCGWIMTCPSCTRALVYHRPMHLAMCHYCQHTDSLPPTCPGCGGKIVYFGYGIQRIEAELARKFPAAGVARMDSDTMTSPRQFQKVFDAFASGDVDILLGTQMVAKGLDFPRVSLVGVVSADTSLAIPDFRSSERTFQLIVQVAGRAGRAEVPGEVVIQTLHAEEPAIQFAIKHDYDGFANNELPHRLQTHLPPFSRMVRFIIRHEKMQKAEAGAEALATALRELLDDEQVKIVGPLPAGVRKIRERFRFQIVVTTDRAGVVQDALAGKMSQLARQGGAEVIVDVDPINLM